jgi:hypothetical protein
MAILPGVYTRFRLFKVCGFPRWLALWRAVRRPKVIGTGTAVS